MIKNFPCFRSIILALLAQFAVIVVAVLAKKFVRKFAGTRNAQSVSPNIESLKIVVRVVANRNFSVKVGMNPICVASKAITAGDMNAMFIPAIFFGLPKIGHALKFGKFALNQIAVKFRLSLSTASAAMSIVKATLKQETVVRFVHKKLASGFPIVERFGLVRVGDIENDEGNVVACVASAPVVVIAIEDIEKVTGSQSRAAIVPLGIAHCEE